MILRSFNTVWKLFELYREPLESMPSQAIMTGIWSAGGGVGPAVSGRLLHSCAQVLGVPRGSGFLGQTLAANFLLKVLLILC